MPTKLRDLYSRDIDASLNPVVSTGNLDEATVATEIREYVFTKDVVDGAYRALDAIRAGSVQHNGIWVSGYFGSGKSHFLKFLSYCLGKRPGALDRVAEAVAKHDPLAGGDGIASPGDWNPVSGWLAANAASVRTILFNMGESALSNARSGADFLTVFWGRFNAMRGYSDANLSLAAYLEKPLDKAGLFGAFKDEIARQGFDWEADRDTLAGTMLDTVLEAAKSVWPQMTADAARRSILENRLPLSVSAFMADVKDWLDAQGPEARLVFCADEVSQYIGNRSNLLLQLQEIVTAFHNVCGKRVWLVCTSQQDLSQITSESGINQSSEEYGKIMGRFPVVVQLSAAATERITRERVLDKTPRARVELGGWFDAHSDEIAAQYEFPAAYPVYGGRDDFVATYPFLDCHLKLVGQVLRAFRDRRFTVENINNNARSVLGATLDVAKATKDRPLGSFVAFDDFYEPMFADGLTALAHSVVQNAATLVEQRPDKPFARRVLRNLFMVCHLDGADAQAFPATLDNLVSLMLTDLSASRKALKDKIAEETDWLCSQSVLMRESVQGQPERFKFYSRAEADVARRIGNVVPGNGDLATEFESLVAACLGSSLRPRAKIGATSVSVGVDAMGRHFLANNPDVGVDLSVHSRGMNLAQFALTVPDTTLVFFLNDLYNQDAKFRKALDDYCRFNLFSRQTPAASEEERDAIEVFRARAEKLRTDVLVPSLEKMLRDAPVLSGNSQIAVPPAKASKRYEEALRKHLERLYPEASAAESLPHSAQALANDVASWQPPLPGAPLSRPEQLVEDYLGGVASPHPAAGAVDHFRKRPYGWDECATLAVLARLVAADRRRFFYNGAPDPDEATVAANLASRTAGFSVAAASAVPRQAMDDFLAAIRSVFGHRALQDSPAQARELARDAKELLGESIAKIAASEAAADGRPFAAPLAALRTAFEDWRAKADPGAFFATVTAGAASVASDWDLAKQIDKFTSGSQWAKYRAIEDYAAANAENAAFLAPDDKAKFDLLAAAKDAAKPWSDLPSWIRLRGETDRAFDARRAEKRAEIDRVYSAVFDELEQLASHLGVARSAFSDRSAAIAEKQSPDSILALENAINAAANFKAGETQKIIAAQPAPAPGPKGGAPRPAAVRSVRLAVSHAAPLATEADVDAYLATLKAQLMAVVETGASVIVQ